MKQSPFLCLMRRRFCTFKIKTDQVLTVTMSRHSNDLSQFRFNAPRRVAVFKETDIPITYLTHLSYYCTHRVISSQKCVLGHSRSNLLCAGLHPCGHYRIRTSLTRCGSYAAAILLYITILHVYIL